MKPILLALVLILSSSFTLAAGDTNVTPYITEKDLPSFVPKKADIQSMMVAIFNGAIELVNIKKMPYTVTAVRQQDGWVYMTVRRFSLVEEIRIGHFDNINSVVLQDGMIKVTYITKAQWNWFSFGIGAAAGTVLGILIGRAFK